MSNRNSRAVELEGMKRSQLMSIARDLGTSTQEASSMPSPDLRLHILDKEFPSAKTEARPAAPAAPVREKPKSVSVVKDEPIPADDEDEEPVDNRPSPDAGPGPAGGQPLSDIEALSMQVADLDSKVVEVNETLGSIVTKLSDIAGMLVTNANVQAEKVDFVVAKLQSVLQNQYLDALHNLASIPELKEMGFAIPEDMPGAKRKGKRAKTVEDIPAAPVSTDPTDSED